MKCGKCNKQAEGWKCGVCDAEAESHDPKHIHGEPSSDRQCMPKCKECSEAESHCKCGE